jgi:hypothetical protein
VTTQLTPHFSIEELSHTDKKIVNVCPLALAGNMLRLAETLEQVRSIIGNIPIHVESGYRCAAVNHAVGGVHNSAHLEARAADFWPIGFDLAQTFDLIRNSGIIFDQLIFEQTWIHLAVAEVGEKPRQESLTAHMGEHGKMLYFHV